jgi:putative transposase
VASNGFRPLSVRGALHAQYRQHPGWTTKLHHDNLRALLGETEVPSYGTVLRYMASQCLDKQRRTEARKKFAPREVRSFEVEHVNRDSPALGYRRLQA